jgi:RimJ/RimL family protein N-acetyltransferase
MALSATAAAADYWPFFNLRITTPRLELRCPTDDDAAEIAALAATGIHPPDFMPFSTPWTDVPPPQQQVKTLQHYWQARSTLAPEAWTLNFAVVDDGQIVGVQDLMSNGDFRVTGAASTGSWVGQAHQGRGIGKEMRAAVLHLAFAGLSADVAFSGAFVDNPASIAVSRSLGYIDDGYEVHSRRGEAARQLRFRLERAAWEPRQRDDIVVSGLAPCLPLLGLGGAEGPQPRPTPPRTPHLPPPHR